MSCAARRAPRAFARNTMIPRRQWCVAAHQARVMLALAVFAAASGAESGPLSRIANVTYAGGVETFLPRMEFERWRPLTGRGDPLRNDPTYDYEPPVLERVRYWPPDRPDSGVATAAAPARADVLMLGTTARRPAQPRPDTRRRYPDAVLVPPPPPPRPPPPVAAAALHSPPGSSLYALQEATLVYHSSTVDDKRATFPLETVTSDYAGWGPTAPLDAPPATDNPLYNLIPGTQFDATENQYAFYRPMLSEAPPPPPPSPAAATSPPEPVTATAARTTPATTSDGDMSHTTDYVTQYIDDETTTEYAPVFLPTLPPASKPPTSRRPSGFVARPSPEPQTAPPPPPPPQGPPVVYRQQIAVRPMSMLKPMMSMPLGSVDDAPPAPASVHLIIQGHSKVKTYGSKAEPPSHRNSIRDDAPKPLDDRQVKHLHPRKEPRMLTTERKTSAAATADDLRALVASGEGGASVQEAVLGIEYDVSDGGDVPVDAYRRGFVHADLPRHPRRQRR